MLRLAQMFDCLVADAFEIGRNFEARHDHPQADSGWLVECKDTDHRS